MKTLRITLTALLGLIAMTALRAAEAKASRIDVIFDHPDKFADAADAQRGSDFGRDAILGELRDYIVERSDRLLPPGQKLTVTVTDVDLAGEVEPWRNPQHSDVRLVKEIYSPRIDLNFKLADASGAVVKEGKRELRDLTFMMNIHPDRNDPRMYEKQMLDDWMRSEFGKAKK